MQKRIVYLVFVGSLVACAMPSDSNVRLGAPTVDKTALCAATEQVLPTMPYVAAQNGIEGWTLIQFDVDAVGRAKNLIALDSKPRAVFDRAAMESISKSTYASSVGRIGCRSTLTFSLR
jgi:TonB family protein